jgi:hypothetical protein
MPDAAPDTLCCLKDRPAGEDSRDDRGEVAVEGDRETARECVPERVPVDLLVIGMPGRAVEIWRPGLVFELSLGSASPPTEASGPWLSVMMTLKAVAVWTSGQRSFQGKGTRGAGWTFGAGAD